MYKQTVYEEMTSIIAFPTLSVLMKVPIRTPNCTSILNAKLKHGIIELFLKINI